MLFSTDGASVDDQVAKLVGGHRIGVGESCTGGLMGARLTERPGSSAYMAGSVVAYSNEAKTELLEVDPGLIERNGAVSPEVAEAMADGALARFGWERFGAAGEPFDPTVHEALMHSHADDVTEPTVVQVLQPGHRIGERVVRAARVAVAEPGA